jgi:hypothetical protein
MPDNLEIIDLRLSSPKSSGQPDVEGGERQYVDITITLRNDSQTSIYQVISDIRKLHYDRNTRTLILGLSEIQLNAEWKGIHLSTPSLRPVLPGETVDLDISIPLLVKRIILSGGPGPHYEVLDITGVEHVNCIISYDETPFPSMLSQPLEQRRRHLQECGITIDKTFDKTLPLNLT